MIAHIWKVSQGWLLEISKGSMPGNFRVVITRTFPTKPEAKRFAVAAGALPWNY